MIMEAFESPTAIAMPVATVRTPPAGGRDVHLFVSTSLQSWETSKPHLLARDVQINDTVFRRLDPEYFAWLRSRMTVAKRALSAGAIPPEVFECLRERFNQLQERAIATFGKPALKDAVRQLAGRRYHPPKIRLSELRAIAQQPSASANGARPDGARPRVAAEAAVDAVRDRALKLGWTSESLFGCSAPGIPGIRCDLVTAMCRPGTRIGQVTRQWIEITGPPPHENILRLYNPDVEQPWVKHVGPRPDGADGKKYPPAG
jgi:hypothetical protein